MKEKSNFDCIFWDTGCTVYAARPVQCRTFPFWQQVTGSHWAWNAAASGCPGMNAGDLRSRETIEACLEQERAAQADLIYRDSFASDGSFESARGA